MDCPVTRQAWESPSAHRLSKGRAGNARVYRVETPEGTFVVKDFRKSPWWIRWTWGRWMIAHEFRLLRALQGMEGVPQRVFRADTYAFGMAFVAGESLGDFNQRNTETCNSRHFADCRSLPVSFFRDLERVVCAMHRRGVSHLDLRNAKNVLITPGNKPVLVDFQSGVILHAWFPRGLRKLLCLADLSSVYKHYCRFYFSGYDIPDVPGGFPRNRMRIFLRHLQLRKLWMLKGYTFLSRRAPKDFEQCLLQQMANEEQGGR